MTYLSKLQNTNEFINLTVLDKFVYLFLTNRTSYLGVLFFNEKLLINKLNISSEDLKNSINNLVSSGFLSYVKEENKLYLIFKDKTNNVSRTAASHKRVLKELQKYDVILRDRLISMGVTDGYKVVDYTPPTKKDVFELCLKRKVDIDIDYMFEYYHKNTIKANKDPESVWCDKNGKLIKEPVKNVLIVWFNNSKTLDLPKNTPKGMECFYVEHKEKFFIPEMWSSAGVPIHSNSFVQKLMRKKLDFYGKK